ncbi:MAG: 4-deoxy-4-formamido-L-arabinose-phosphoundecaprenol deformylase [Elusimicrobiota bacterium]|jgi:peptidoglycan/xylan/chitin deacetylase (PgdA/CDA1 family)|nr:4-deoxy-4-formamido-L-arabinose-phosphoundecaprenol deformylase [Elusimicrobiota bacterium]
MSEKNKNILALKVDVDTLKGYLEGVPRMAGVLARHNVKAGFYFSLGPDNSGRAIFRIFRKGFIQKMLRTNAPGTYGFKTMMYGTLLPAPMIAGANTRVMKDIFKAGHECGLHAWDHVKWQDKLPKLTAAQIKDDLKKAAVLFENILGVQPRAFAAPGWQLTAAALEALDSFKFDYVSNTRGRSPFMPSFEGRRFNTPEIPSTLPTMDEVFGADGIDDGNVAQYYLNLLKPGLNVHTVHAEMEGGAKIKQFEEIVKGALERGYEIKPLCDIAKELKDLPEGIIELGFLPGRAGAVAVQK